MHSNEYFAIYTCESCQKRDRYNAVWNLPIFSRKNSNFLTPRRKCRCSVKTDVSRPRSMLHGKHVFHALTGLPTSKRRRIYCDIVMAVAGGKKPVTKKNDFMQAPIATTTCHPISLSLSLSQQSSHFFLQVFFFFFFFFKSCAAVFLLF